MAAKEVIGIGWKFPPQFRAPTEGPEMADETALLEQAIYILLNTRVGERPLAPKFGSGIGDFVFTEATPFMLTELKEEIAHAILESEPRIRLENINYDLANVYEGRVNIVLEYLVKQTNARNNMVFPFYLTEKSI